MGSDKITKLKEKYQTELEEYGSQVNRYISEHGNDKCDYLQYRKDMCHYYRGAYNALIELERV